MTHLESPSGLRATDPPSSAGTLLGSCDGTTEAPSESPESVIASLRAGEGGPGPHALDFSGQSLVGLDLSALDLRGAVFARADLSRANLENAVLLGANLCDAVLFEANLRGAELGGANLAGAKLEGARAKSAGFGRATLDGASLSTADLEFASLTDASAIGADFRAARLSGARLRGARLERADFSRADLRDGDLYLARVDGASFSGANLCGARLGSIQGYQAANWLQADVRDVDFNHAHICRRFILDQNYIEEFRNQSRGSRWVYHVWKLTSDCGRSLLRWGLTTVAIALLFGAGYTQVVVDYGRHPTPLSPFYFSVVTLTTLGYGDVQPASPEAQVLCMLEVFLGYVMLGGLLSIFSNKMARRAE